MKRIKKQDFWVMMVVIVFANMFLKGTVSSIIFSAIKLPDVLLDFVSGLLITSVSVLFGLELFKEAL